MLETLFLLLPVGVWYGWVMGRNSALKAQRKQSRILSRHYFRGLNFLLSDQPDKAVDTLIKMINVDNGSIETHIAMGNFFRHRGELDRAIRIHQNLVSKQGITDDQKSLALKELGRDYLLAGFLERAENAFLQLLDSDRYHIEAQRQLFNIYQTTKEWDRAIELAERMVEVHGNNEELFVRVAHFYCEQAELEAKQQHLEQAHQLLLKAVNADKKAVRPYLMLGELAIADENYTQAFSYLEKVPERDIQWLSEAIPLIQRISEKSNIEQEYERFLEKYWRKCATAYLAQVQRVEASDGVDAAVQSLTEQLRSNPTMKGFRQLMAYYLEQDEQTGTHSSIQLLMELVDEQMTRRPKYRCGSCGFSGQRVYWLCPSCKKWGVVKPIKGLDGE